MKVLVKVIVVVISMIGDAFQRYEVKFNALDSVTNKQIK